MDESRVLARLDRIDELDRAGAAPAVLLAELRGLLREAEALTCELDDGQRGDAERVDAERVDAERRDAKAGAATSGEEVVGRLRTALARDIIGM